MSLGMTASEIVPGVADPSELADTSALARVPHHDGVRLELLDRLKSGAVACCEITRLEMGLTARNAREHGELGRLLAALPQATIVSGDYERAWEVQAMLVRGSRHREVQLPDLLVAACAERLGLTVIHCDSDFELITEVTGQPVRWAVDRDLL